MCGCSKKLQTNQPPPPEFKALASGGVRVKVGAKSTCVLNFDARPRVVLKVGSEAPVYYNEAVSLIQGGAPIWISK